MSASFDPAAIIVVPIGPEDSLEDSPDAINPAEVFQFAGGHIVLGRYRDEPLITYQQAIPFHRLIDSEALCEVIRGALKKALGGEVEGYIEQDSIEFVRTAQSGVQISTETIAMLEFTASPNTSNTVLSLQISIDSERESDYASCRNLFMTVWNVFERVNQYCESLGQNFTASESQKEKGKKAS